MPITKTLINHVNCKVVAIPGIMKFISFCADVETFDRCLSSYKIWFFNIKPSRESLQIIIECKGKDEYDFAVAKFDTAKSFLMAAEPERMLELELPEKILGRVATFIKKEMKWMK